MYVRRIKDRTLTLAVSGKLWRGSLVMIDKETRSLWSHLRGEAMQGELVGATLQSVPSTITGWAAWRRAHPDTTIATLKRSSMQYREPMMRGADDLLIGLAAGEASKVWYLRDLKKSRVVNTEFAEHKIVVCYAALASTAVIFDRTVDGRELTFEMKEGELRDRETGGRWNPLTGKGTGGPSEGKQLKLLPGIISYDFAWSDLQPRPSNLKQPTEGPR